MRINKYKNIALIYGGIFLVLAITAFTLPEQVDMVILKVAGGFFVFCLCLQIVFTCMEESLRRQIKEMDEIAAFLKEENRKQREKMRESFEEYLNTEEKKDE